MLLFLQLRVLQEKNLLVTRRHKWATCCQCCWPLIIAFLFVLPFVFITNPFYALPTRTYEDRGTTLAPDPDVDLFNPFPAHCSAFSEEGAKLDDIDIEGYSYSGYYRGDGRGNHEQASITKFFEDVKLVAARSYYEFGFASVHKIHQIVNLRPAFAGIQQGFGLAPNRKTVIRYRNHLEKLTASASDAVQQAYAFLDTCPPHTITIDSEGVGLVDCRVILTCMILRMEWLLSAKANEYPCSQRKLKSYEIWTNMSQKAEPLFRRGLQSFRKSQQSCGTISAPLEWNALERLPVINEYFNTHIDAEPAISDASSTSNPAADDTQAIRRLREEHNRGIASASTLEDFRSSRSASQYQLPAHSRMTGNLLLDRLFSAGTSVLPDVIGATLSSSTKPRILSSSMAHDSGITRPRRLLQKECGKINDACQCALHEGCGWRQYEEVACRPPEDLGTPGAETWLKLLETADKYQPLWENCSQAAQEGRRGFNIKRSTEAKGLACPTGLKLMCRWQTSCVEKDDGKEKHVTSCWECPRQEGCDENTLWKLIPAAVPRLYPQLRIFEDANSLDDHMTREDYQQVNGSINNLSAEALCAAIVLDKVACIKRASDCSYMIRLNKTMLAPKTTQLTTLNPYFGLYFWGQYHTSGFLKLQKTTDDFLFEKSYPLRANDKPWFNLVPFPISERRRIEGLSFLMGTGEGGNLGALILLFMGTIVLAFPIVSRALREKDDQLREVMRVMGLSDGAYYMSQFVWAVMWFFLPSIGVTLVLFLSWTKTCTGENEEDCSYEIGKLFMHSNPFWLFLLWMLGCVAQASFALTLVPLVGRGRTGRILAVLLMFFLSSITFADPRTSTEKSACALIPAVAILYGLRTFVALEAEGLGLTLSSLHISVENYAFSTSLWMLALDIVLYGILLWYLDQTAPYGIGQQSPFFLFTSNYWHGTSRAQQRRVNEKSPLPGNAEVAATLGPSFEAPSRGCQEMANRGQTLEVRGLRKLFKIPGRIFAAVDGVDMTMYPGEIYVLLGHNGAGKSTTISCLTGHIRPTSGTATLFGHPLSKVLNTSRGRRIIGICPQKSVFWEELTCLEHCNLFGAFRGLERMDALKFGFEMLDQIGLLAKARKRVGTLSGGMKRKLCLALALLGETKVCFLDEPTSGMDPSVRRDVWDLLRRQKDGRILVLTTHCMDEADILSDRIGVMAAGQLQCVGSPLFLKRYYGCGYNLIFDMITLERKRDLITVVQNKLRGTGQGDTVRVVSEDRQDLVLLVDFNASKGFPELFRTLDDTTLRRELFINSWSISVCHLDEVFLRVTRGNAGSAASMNISPNILSLMPVKHSMPKPEVVGATEEYPSPPEENVRVLRSCFPCQLGAMCSKRLKYSKRDPMLCFCQLLCPSFAAAIALAMIRGLYITDPPIEFDLSNYNEGEPGTVVPLGSYEVQNKPPTATQEYPYMNLKKALRLEATDVPQVDLDKLTTCISSNNATYGWDCELDDSVSNLTLAELVGRTSCYLLNSVNSYASSRYVAVAPFDKSFNDPPNLLLAGNTTSLHVAPTALNLGTNLIRRTYGTKGRVRVGSHPFPITSLQRSKIYEDEGLLEFFAQLFPVWIFPFPMAFAAAYVIRERELRIKAQHFLSGVSPLTYWIACIFCDLLSFLISCALVYLPLWVTSVDSVVSQDVIICLAIYGIAQVPFSYLLGNCFATAGSAQSGVLAFNIGVTFVLGTAAHITRTFNQCWQKEGQPLFSFNDGNCTKSVNDWLDPAVRIVPGCALFEALMAVAEVTRELRLNPLETRTDEWYSQCENDRANKLVSRWACVDDVFDPDAAAAPLFQLCIVAIIYCLLLVLIDSMHLSPTARACLQYSAPAIRKPEKWEDEDVQAEHLDMHHKLPHEVACKLSQIRKVYGPVGLRKLQMCFCGRRSRTKGAQVKHGFECCGLRCCDAGARGNVVHAVKGVSFAVRRGQVFGVLGANGAGKSTIFNMLAGVISPTDGQMYVEGQPMTSGGGASRARKRVGYIPQENALFELLTTHEHLEFYSRLKGVPLAEVRSVVASKLRQLGLDTYANNYAPNLSGGNRRKLMAAIALIGEPSTVLGDEPSSGMDPVSRRSLWRAIQEFVGQQQSMGQFRNSVVLSTHSMEECEAICMRSAIMVNGIFRCIGTNREIKERYGINGYELVIKIMQPNEADVMKLIRDDWEIPLETLANASKHKLTFQQAQRHTKDSDFHLAALHGPSSPYADRSAGVAEGVSPRVVAEWWLLTSRFHRVHSFVHGAFSKPNQAELTDWHGNMCRYKLTCPKSLADMFEIVEKEKINVGIADYSLSATTLEQIFNTFICEQEDANLNESRETSHGAKAMKGARADGSIEKEDEEFVPLADYKTNNYKNPKPIAKDRFFKIATETPIRQHELISTAVVSASAPGAVASSHATVVEVQHHVDPLKRAKSRASIARGLEVGESREETLPDGATVKEQVSEVQVHTYDVYAAHLSQAIARGDERARREVLSMLLQAKTAGGPVEKKLDLLITSAQGIKASVIAELSVQPGVGGDSYQIFQKVTSRMASVPNV